MTSCPCLFHDPGGVAGSWWRLRTADGDRALPRNAFGVISLAATYEAPATHELSMFDDQRVLIETISAEMTITQPRELAIFERMFARLAGQAVYGNAARGLIAAALKNRRAVHSPARGRARPPFSLPFDALVPVEPGS